MSENAGTWNAVHAAIPHRVSESPKGPFHVERTAHFPTVRGEEVECRQPGKHAGDTDPVGGDFVVQVRATTWSSTEFVPFTHAELFTDYEVKARTLDAEGRRLLARRLVLTVVDGIDPASISLSTAERELPGIAMETLLRASQLLSIAEHRRYAKHEPEGGRYLPMRFTIGIIEGRWTAAEASRVQRQGKHGLKRLRRRGGQESDEAAFRAG